MSRLILSLVLVGCGKQTVEERTIKGDDRVAYSRDCSTPLGCTAEDGTADCTEEYLPTDDQRHLEGELDYPVYPPAGGAHYRCWWDWGVSEEEVPEERWVHNMEHGGVVFLYNCPEGCDDEVEQIVAAVGERERVIVSPYSHMEWRFAAVSWEYRTLMDCLDIDQMVAFYTEHFGKGPEDVASMPPTGCMDEDTGGADTGGADTGGADTGTGDTGGADTGGADTGGADTGTGDSEA